LFEIIGVVTLILVGSVTCFLYGRFNGHWKTGDEKKKRGNHVELVEENMREVTDIGKEEKKVSATGDESDK
jgi:hypothetical protein